MKEKPPTNHDTPIAVRLQVSEESLGNIRYQLETGTLFIPAFHPLPPETQLTIELQNEDGSVLMAGEAVVVAWNTLLHTDESWDTPGMRIQAKRPKGHASSMGESLDFDAMNLKDASAIIAAQIDLDGDDEPLGPVPLPDIQPDATPDLCFRDVSELYAEQFDLDSDRENMQASPPTHEQRQDPRSTIEIPIKAKVMPDGEEFEGATWNISTSGLFIRTQKSLKVDSTLELLMHPPKSDKPVKIDVKVVREQQQLGPSTHPAIPGVGLRFIDPASELCEQIKNDVDKNLLDITHLEQSTKEPPPQTPQAVPATHFSPAAQKKLVVDSLITALEISRVKDFKNNETLRYLLEVWYPEYHKAGTVDLTLLWNTLGSDESIQAMDAALPLFIFSLARREHGLSVILPESLSRFSKHETAIALARQRIEEAGSFRDAYNQVAHHRAESRKNRNAKQKKKTTPKPLPAWPRQQAKPKTRRKTQAAVKQRTPIGKRVFVAGIAIVACAITFLAIQPNRAEHFDSSNLNDLITLDQARVQNHTMQATITDKRWHEMNDEDQRHTIKGLLDKLSNHDVSSMLLFDDDQMLAASARLTEDGAPVIKIGQEVLMEPQSRK